MSEMVERVARALCRNEARDPDEVVILGSGFTPDSIEQGLAWQLKAGAARAVIAAMREPTEEMVAAGMRHDAVDLASEYRAMIDAALSEEPAE